MTMPDFTPRQGRYLSYIHAYNQRFDMSPLPAEIAVALNVSAATVNQMLNMLEKKELVRRGGEKWDIEVLLDRNQIPKWEGRRFPRTLVDRPLVNEPVPTSELASSEPEQVYCFKITLMGSQPLIWRRIETADVGLDGLHEYIQAAMGWTNSHLHQFHIHGKRYSDPRIIEGGFDDFGAIDYTDIRISDLVAQHGPKLRMVYEYDFGDGWEHSVVLEKISDANPRQNYPRCITGKRACPPEDVGGVYGYEEFLEAIEDPEHESHEDYMDWIGPFDPEEFSPEEATIAMRNALPES